MIITGLEYYADSYEFPVRLPNFTKTRIQIIDEDTFTAAKRFDNACCLNFASHKRPGGGYKAVENLRMPIKTQEEDLFRRSDLPLTMDSEDVRRNYYPLKGRAALYTSRALVTKDKNLDPVSTYAVSVVTMPAVVNPRPEDHDLVVGKAKRVLEIAAHHRHYDLILGAWGCGIFGNDPEEIAEIFRSLIRGEFEGIFDLILFAIPGRESKNFKLFEQALTGKDDGQVVS